MKHEPGRPVLLDAFCGAGGAAEGYWRAGFNVIGVDIKPQPRYPFGFIQADALEFIQRFGHRFAAIHASPPCQGYSSMQNVVGPSRAPRLINPVRDLLRTAGRPYVIENVEGAKAHMQDYVMFCGSMLRLTVRRHRLFECSPIWSPPQPECHCRNGVRDGWLIGHRLRGPKPPGQVVPPVFTDDQLRQAIGVPWMTIKESRDAIPPRYTNLIGLFLMQILDKQKPPPGD